MSGLSGWKVSAALKTFRSSSVPLVLALPIVLSVSFIAIAVAADTISEKFQKKLEAADNAYQAAVQKAENTKFYAVQKATADRVKVLKQAMTEATKAGDLDAATEIKGRITAAEQSGGVRAKPKNLAKFGGHEYALLEDKATWHVAKRICQEMGGHLVTLESPQEAAFVLTLCRDSKTNAWIGLSNEVEIDQWAWVTGEQARLGDLWKFDDPDREHVSAGGVYWHDYQAFTDYNFGYHVAFICEWDN